MSELTIGQGRRNQALTSLAGRLRKAGLSEGAMVVTSGQLKLKNGSPLRIDNSVQPLNDQNPTPQER